MVRLHPNLQGKEFTYDDIIVPNELLPDFGRDEVDISTYFTRNIRLKSPISSAPMDTVTNSDMAILMALQGGIGIIHFNFPTVNDQIDDALKVKRFQAAFVKNPVVLGPDNTIGDVYRISQERGFYSVPITADGKQNSPMIGIVTRRDVRYREDTSTQLRHVMTPREKLVVAHRRDTLDKNDIRAANRIIRERNLDTLPIVDDDFVPIALVTDSDLRKNDMYPLATKDDNKQLRVGIACEANLSNPEIKRRIYERLHSAYDASLDVAVFDQSTVFMDQLRLAEYATEEFKGRLDKVIGNVCTGAQVREIIKNAYKYTDAVKVGHGPGFACTTQENLGLGRPQGTAVYECAEELKGQAPVIADGGIQGPGDILKALMLGAGSIMAGSLFAAYDESAAPKIRAEEVKDGRVTAKWMKKYRGMASLEALEERGSKTGARYGVEGLPIQVSEGVVRYLEPAGSGYDRKYGIPHLLAGVKQALQNLGFKNIKEAQENGYLVPWPIHGK